MTEITHPFYDIEIATSDDGSDSSLVKILSVSGRRFTYLVTCPLDGAVVDYIKEMIDGGFVSDLVIDRTDQGLRSRESNDSLLKHG
jgi:hypothetical protein